MSPGSVWVMFSGSPWPSKADSRPCRCGLFTPRGPLTIGMIADLVVLSVSVTPGRGAAFRFGANVEPSMAATSAADASWCKYWTRSSS
ncbi:MAG: hypothetical protein M3474_04115 [Actinomycetota bacterium]|nr:hypothetical protein [Actinomycetota bacterium]